MTKKRKTKPEAPSTKDLIGWLRALRLHQDGSAEPVGIPGLDSYAPSYLSGGADTRVIQNDGDVRIHGQLEQHIK